MSDYVRWVLLLLFPAMTPTISKIGPASRIIQDVVYSEDVRGSKHITTEYKLQPAHVASKYA